MSRVISCLPKRTSPPSLIALAVTLGLQQPVFGQETDGATNPAAMEEVIVTALKRDQTIYEAPVSITALSEQQLQQLGTQELNDYLGFIPNVSATSGGGRRQWDISIRGLSNIEGVANTYGIFMDEFNISPTSISAFNNPSLQDAAQIEVLRGPQGVYFGRSIMGGAINITTNKPSDQFEGNISARVGSNERYQVRGAVSAPIIEDKLSFRLLGYYEEFGGYIDNNGPADVTNDFEEQGLRLALRWTPTDRTTIDIAGAFVDAEDSLPNTLAVGIPIQGVADFISPLTFGVINTLEDLAELQGTALYPDGDEHEVNVDEATTSENEAMYVTLRAEHEFDGFSFITVAGYMEGREETNDLEADFALNETPFVTPFGAPATFLADYNITTLEEVESFSVEMRLQSNDSGPLQWVIGALYAEDTEEQRDDDFLTIGTVLAGNFGGISGPLSPSLDFDKVESAAIFGDISYAFFDERLTLSAGARYSDDTFSSNGFNGESVINPGVEGVRPNESVSFTNFAPTFTAAYAVTDDVNVYAKAANAYRPGGLNNNFLVPDSYDSEDLWSYELGLKGVFLDGRLDLRVAAYVMEWEDVQTTVFDPDLLLAFIGNASSSTLEGFEFEGNWNITDRWLWQVGLGYTKAEYDEFVGGFVPDRNDPVDLSGTPLPNAPEWTVNSQLQYTHPLNNGASIFIRGEYQFTDEQFATPGGDEFNALKLDDYEVFNLRAGYNDNRYTVTVFAENLADDYFLQGSSAGIYPLGLRSAINEGRRFGIRGEYFF